ncbi:8-oxo-dGTP diphosphatase [archaeon]|nr:8-oxo-dGTP diphosphatase [archaeon]MBT4272051.1 8-oxo-dGTP diphosphatase [archaeon]
MKKTGFGKGKYLGIGGKVEEGETIEQAAIREVQEEIGVVVKNIKKVGTLNFYFPFVEKPQKWNQKVHIFITENWEGEIIESEEMKPSWFNKKELPFDSMWSDAPYWTPLILDNKKIHAEFMFNKELEIIENIVLIN